MAVAHRDTQKAVNTAGAVTVTKPTGTASGDVLVATVGIVGSSTPTIDNLTGWVKIAQQASSTTLAGAMFMRVAGGSEPSTYTFTATGTVTEMDATISAFSGYTDPVLHEFGSNGNAASTTATFSPVIVAHDSLLVCGGATGASVTWTKPSAFTEPTNGSTGFVETSYLIGQAANSRIGAPTATLSASQASVGMIVAICERPTPSITARTAQSGTATTGSVTVTTPSGTTLGDLLVASVMVRGTGTPTINTPSGWTLATNVAIGTSHQTAVFWKRAGRSEPASTTFTANGTTVTQLEAIVEAYVGFTDPVVADVNTLTAATANQPVPEVRLPTDGLLVFAMGFNSASAVSWTTAQGYASAATTARLDMAHVLSRPQCISTAGRAGTADGTAVYRQDAVVTSTPNAGKISVAFVDAGVPGAALAGHAIGTGTTSAVVTLATVQDGDLMVAFVQSSGGATGAPAGWIQIDDLNPSASIHVTTFYKVASGEGTTFTFTGTTATKVDFLRFKGAQSLDVHSALSNAASTSVTATGVTLSAARLLIWFGALASGNLTGLPAGFAVASVETVSTRKSLVGYVLRKASGATGNEVGAVDSSNANQGFLVSFVLSTSVRTDAGSATAGGGTITASVDTAATATAGTGTAGGGAQTAAANTSATTTAGTATASGGTEQATSGTSASLTAGTVIAAGGAQAATADAGATSTAGTATAGGRSQQATSGVASALTAGSAVASGGTDTGSVAYDAAVVAGSAVASGGTETATIVAHASGNIAVGGATASGGSETATADATASLVAGSAVAAGGLDAATVDAIAALLAGAATASGGDETATSDAGGSLVRGTAFVDGGILTVVVRYPRQIAQRFTTRPRPAAFSTQDRPEFTVAGRPAIATRPDSREG